jgi:hypothetical protein
MSDDFGTVNLRPGARTRESELLRRHREMLVQMTREIDEALAGLESGRASEPAMRPLADAPHSDYETHPDMVPGASAPRVVLMIAVALVALAVIGWLIWRASSDRKPAATETGTVVEETAAPTVTTTTPPPETGTIAPVTSVADALRVAPPANDYGLIRKGTRATRQFEIANTTDEPISIALSRSACRCLYYEHSEVVPPKGKETITVTVDGARAKAGTLRETVKVTAKKDASIATSFDITATIR